MHTEDDPTCSFCGRSRSEVTKLITGPKASICDGCVFLSYNIIEMEVGDSWSATSAVTFEAELSALREHPG